MPDFEYVIVSKYTGEELSCLDYAHAMKAREAKNGYLCEVRMKVYLDGELVNSVTLVPANDAQERAMPEAMPNAEQFDYDEFELADIADVEMPEDISDKFSWTSEDFYLRLCDRVQWTEFLKAPYEYAELWEARYNRQDQIAEHDFYHTGVLHIRRILDMWDKGMSGTVGLLSVTRLMSDVEMCEILEDLINLNIAMQENNLVDMCHELRTLQITLDTIQTGWQEILELPAKGGEGNAIEG